MKKRIILCIAIITTITMLLVGCTTVSSKDTTSDRVDSMFIKVGYNDTIGCNIIYDKETKVMYTATPIGRYNRGTITMLVNTNGTPKLWKE